mmetsp:Transcript_126549/g.404290  ORF Transcript_126549/g.404290 Transcript_126549/m.404290 type:complete len:402 (+) Transcript_126549:116-1321(+)
MIHNRAGLKIETRYELGQTIGKGSFGIVRRAYRRRHTEEVVAVKVAPKLTEGGNDDEAALQNEIKLLSKLLHPCVLRTYEVFETEDKLMLVMEFCDGGEVFSGACAPPVAPQEMAAITLDVLSALSYLHGHGITHRDLKPPNLLRDFFGRTKLADFGLSKVFKAGRMPKREMKSMLGTPGYMAPEVISGEPYDERCDIYSLGVVVFFGLAGHLPFPPSDGDEIAMSMDVEKLAFPTFWPVDAADFVRSSMSLSNQDRPSATEAIGLPFVRAQLAPPSEHEPELDSETVDELLVFARASPLARTMAVFAARHLNLHRVPRMKAIGVQFLTLDAERAGTVPPERFLAAVVRASPGTSKSEAQCLTDELVKAGPAGSRAVEYAAFLAAVAVHNRWRGGSLGGRV